MRVSLPLEWPGAIAAACERLIHPSVKEAAERRCQHRLACALFIAPFLAAGGLAQLLAPQWSAAPVVGLACAVFGLSWLLASVLLMTGRRRPVGALSTVCATALVAFTIALAGGPASPLALMAAALVLEAAWIGKSRRILAVGVPAAAVAVLGGAGLAGALPDGITVQEISASHWLIPLAYCATLALRLPFFGSGDEKEVGGDETGDLTERLKAVVLRMNRSGEVLSVSQQAESILKVPGAVLLGGAFFDRVHVADRVAYLCALSTLREGGEEAAVRIRLRMPGTERRDNLPYYRAFSIELLADGGGFAAVVRDDSERENLEAEIAAARKEATRARQESRRVVAAVSHELRTPLNAILGFSDALLTEIFGRFTDARQRDYVRLIHEAGAHLLSVVNATLDISRAEAGAYRLEPEPFFFEDAVATGLALIRPQAEAGAVTVKTAISKDVGIVNCDRRAVQQVLINLLSNAVKFTPANGRVLVSAICRGERLELSVEDNGAGMSAEDLTRVGEPFVQVRNDDTRHVEGTGLGLALVKALVGLHGGGVSIESVPGAGTRVSVWLPAGPKCKPEKAGAEVKRAESPIMDQEWNDEDDRKTA